MFESPFWRNGSDITQTVTSAIDPDPALPVREAFDISPPGGPGIIASFLYPDHAFGLLEQVGWGLLGRLIGSLPGLHLLIAPGVPASVPPGGR